MKSARIESVDLARGVASLIMIQGHAFDGWVAPAYKASAAYLFTRVLGTLPLPAFMVLAGASLALRLRAADAVGEPASALRPRIVRRGLTIVAWGYAASWAYAVIDGHDGLPTLLRADVLHAIGLSIALLALWAVPARGPLLRGAVRRGAGLAVAVTLLCPLLTPLTRDLSGPTRYLVALVSQVDGVTRMPVVPLLAWTAAGMAAGAFVVGDRPRLRLLLIALVGLGLAVAGHLATEGLLVALGGPLDRAHPAVIPGVVEYLGRGLLVLGLGGLAGLALPQRQRRWLVTLGRGSLVAYVVHIPFCYGTLAGPLAASADVAGALPFVLALMLLGYTAVVAAPRLSELARTLVPRPQRAPT